LLLPVCWHSILIGVWLKEAGIGEEKTAQGLTALAVRLFIDCVQIEAVEIESSIVNYKTKFNQK